MRVLWTANLIVPRGAAVTDPGSATFGGWISTMLAQLRAVEGMELAVAVRSHGPSISKQVLDGVTYYYLPPSRRDAFDISEADCRAVLEDFRPDLLHAEGAEMAYSTRFLRNWSGPNIVSLQGVLSGFEPYEYGGLAMDDLLLSLRPRRMLTATAMVASKRLRFLPRLRREAQTIGLAKALLGRTDWDRAHAQPVNPGAPYFSVNRILRPPFYETPWTIEGMRRHSLFIGNVAAPRKGGHFAVRAAALLRARYPDIHLYIAGESPAPKSWRDWKKHVGYGAYLRGLITELDMEDRVTFTGVLSAAQMAERMRQSHVFVLSSLIENSPNTLGEAMLLGAPVVSAFAGGAPDMAQDRREALFYRAEDPQMLAYRIGEIFESDALAVALGQNARRRARETHDPIANRDRLLAAYRVVLEASA